jgi:hypothetical protein
MSVTSLLLEGDSPIVKDCGKLELEVHEVVSDLEELHLIVWKVLFSQGGEDVLWVPCCLG